MSIVLKSIYVLLFIPIDNKLLQITNILTWNISVWSCHYIALPDMCH